MSTGKCQPTRVQCAVGTVKCDRVPLFSRVNFVYKLCRGRRVSNEVTHLKVPIEIMWGAPGHSYLTFAQTAEDFFQHRILDASDLKHQANSLLKIVTYILVSSAHSLLFTET